MQSPVSASLAEFSRGHLPARTATSSRAGAAVLTAALYMLVAFLVAHPSFWVPPDPPVPSEIVASLLPDEPVKKVIVEPPPFLARLIKPPAQSISPPAFTIASDAPPAPAEISASAVKSSPMTSGLPISADTVGQGGTADGLNGNGNDLAGCYDAAWAKAVSDRIGSYFYYPRSAAQRHVTGVVILHLVIRRSGRLARVEIGKTSGDAALDRAAYEMAQKAERLPRIPDRMHVTQIETALPIEFGVDDPTLKPSIGTCY